MGGLLLSFDIFLKRDRFLPGLIEGLDMLFTPEILKKCREWHNSLNAEYFLNSSVEIFCEPA
jgi:hypothetical protein